MFTKIHFIAINFGTLTSKLFMMWNRNKRKPHAHPQNPLLLVMCVFMATTPAQMRQNDKSAVPDVSGLRVPEAAATVVDSRLRQATGQVEVWVQLVDAPLAAAAAAADGRATTDSTEARPQRRRQLKLDRAAQRDYLRGLAFKQDEVMSRIRGLGGRELGRVRKAHNAVAVSIDASQIEAVGALPGVRAVRPVVQYQLDLSETVSYIGASAVQAAGVDGTGVKVAVLDTGIDYTHRNLGGEGTTAAYEAAYGTSASDPRNNVNLR